MMDTENEVKNRLGANVKAYFGHPAFWLLYVVIGVLWAQLIRNWELDSLIFVVYVSCLWCLAGVAAGALQREVMARPVAFCLPNARRVRGRTVVVLGVVFNLLLALSIAGKTLDGWTLDGRTLGPVALLAIGMCGLAVFLWVALLVMRATNFTWGFLLAFVAVGVVFMAEHFPFKEVFFTHPLGVIGLSGLAGFVAWRMIASPTMARSWSGRQKTFLSGQEKEDNFDGFGFRWWGESKPTRTQKWLLARMNGSPMGSAWRTAYGFLFSIHPNLLSLKMAAYYILLFGYCFDVDLKHGFCFVFLLIIGSATPSVLGPPATLLNPAGRRERFLGTLLAGSMVIAWTMLVVALATVCAVWLAPWMPSIPSPFSDESWVFTAPALSGLVWFPLLMPMGFAAVTFMGKEGLLVGAVAVCVVLGCFHGLLESNLLALALVLLFAFGALSWGAWIGVLYVRCFGCDLVRE